MHHKIERTKLKEKEPVGVQACSKTRRFFCKKNLVRTVFSPPTSSSAIFSFRRNRTMAVLTASRWPPHSCRVSSARFCKIIIALSAGCVPYNGNGSTRLRSCKGIDRYRPVHRPFRGNLSNQLFFNAGLCLFRKKKGDMGWGSSIDLKGISNSEE